MAEITTIRVVKDGDVWKAATHYDDGGVSTVVGGDLDLVLDQVAGGADQGEPVASWWTETRKALALMRRVIEASAGQSMRWQAEVGQLVMDAGDVGGVGNSGVSKRRILEVSAAYDGFKKWLSTPIEIAQGWSVRPIDVVMRTSDPYYVAPPEPKPDPDQGSGDGNPNPDQGDGNPNPDQGESTPPTVDSNQGSQDGSGAQA